MPDIQTLKFILEQKRKEHKTLIERKTIIENTLENLERDMHELEEQIRNRINYVKAKKLVPFLREISKDGIFNK